MDATIIVAIIAGTATIIAAVIAGIFSLRKSKNDSSDKPSQSIQAGGNIITANGSSIQTVNITTTNNPQEPKPSHLLLDTIREILNVLNVASKENQTILAPLFLDSPKIEKIRQEFMTLYNVQGQRANFSKWGAILKNYSTTNNELSSKLCSLRILLGRINEKFYQDDVNHLLPRHGPVEWVYYTKVGLISAFRDQSLTVEQLRILAESYLCDLREKVDIIGRIIGEIEVIENNSNFGKHQ